MEQPGARLAEEDSEEDEGEQEDSGPEGALGKSPLQLTPEDVYDISSAVGRELAALGGGQDPRVARLQFTIVRVLELLETLVSEAGVAAEELRLERDSLRHELEGLRRAAGGQVGARDGALGRPRGYVPGTLGASPGAHPMHHLGHPLG